MGGSLRVRSVVGVGSTFTVDINLRLPEPAAIDEPVPISSRFARSLFDHAVLLLDGSYGESRDVVADTLRVRLSALGLRGSAVHEAHAADARAVADAIRDIEGIEWERTVVLVDEFLLDGAAPLLSARGCRVVVLRRAMTSSGNSLRVDDSRVVSIIRRPVRLTSLFEVLMHPTAPEPLSPKHDQPARDVMSSRSPRSTNSGAGGSSSNYCSRPSTAVSAESSGRSGSRMRVLIVDDVRLNRKVLCRLLRRVPSVGTDVDVFFASDGAEAVEMVRSSPPFSIIFCDLMMPVMDGFRAMRHIRDLPATNATPVVAVTANADAETKHRCRCCGFVRVLVKPISSSDLERAIEQFVLRREK